MENKDDVRFFFSVFIGATAGVMLEVIATLVDEIVVGNLFTDEAFASVNLIEPYTILEVFIAYLASVAGAALIVRAHGAGDYKKMSELFSQTMIVCGLCGFTLTMIYVLFTPQLVRFVADDPTVYENALEYFKIMRFYPLVDMFDTFMFAYVLYRGGFLQFYTGIILRIGVNVLLSWQLGLRMGLMGIGLASIISLIVALLVKLTFLLNSKHGLKFIWYFNIREAIEVSKLGFSESAISIFIVIMEMTLNNYTLKNYGAAGVAAVAVVINIFEFTFYLSEGISEYVIVSVNDSIGKNSSKSMDRAIKIMKRAAFIEGVVMTVLIFIGADVLPDAFDIDNEETARIAAFMLRILAPTAIFICFTRVTAIFICFTRVTAIFYQYTRRILRTLILFGMAIALMPILLGIILGRISSIGIALGIALGPVAAVTIMYVFVRYKKREKLFDYALMNLDL